jgi:hypothetical protein
MHSLTLFRSCTHFAHVVHSLSHVLPLSTPLSHNISYSPLSISLSYLIKPPLSSSSQAIYRVYRYGQTKNVFVYRLLSSGSMEEKIYKKQVTKRGTIFNVHVSYFAHVRRIINIDLHLISSPLRSIFYSHHF